MENKLKRSQELILNALEEYTTLNYEDISEVTGLSYDGVRGRISELINMGYELLRFRDNGTTFITYKIDKGYRRPKDIKDSITQRTLAVDDFNNITDFLDEMKKLNVVSSKTPQNLNNKSAVLLLSDLHFGELIYAPGGKLIYNTKIATSRMTTLIEKTIEKLKTKKIKHLYLLGLGDIIDGDMIYRNHLFRVEKPAIEQIKDAVKAVTEGIKKILASGITIDMSNVRGNHGITNYNNLEEDNWDSVVYDMLYLIFSDDERISITNFKGSEGLVNIGSKQIVIFHGNGMSSQIKTASGLRTFRGMCGKHKLNDGDMIVVGHLHEFGVESDQGKFLVRNGSLSDASEYAYKLNLYSEPMQTLMILDDTKTYPIFYPINV